MKTDLRLTIYRMPDETEGHTLRASHVLMLGTTPLIRAYVDLPLTPWSPEMEWPEDMWSLALSLERALGIMCSYRDIRGEVAKPPVSASAVRLSASGVKLRV